MRLQFSNPSKGLCYWHGRAARPNYSRRTGKLRKPNRFFEQAVEEACQIRFSANILNGWIGWHVDISVYGWRWLSCSADGCVSGPLLGLLINRVRLYFKASPRLFLALHSYCYDIVFQQRTLGIWVVYPCRLHECTRMFWTKLNNSSSTESVRSRAGQQIKHA